MERTGQSTAGTNEQWQYEACDVCKAEGELEITTRPQTFRSVNQFGRITGTKWQNLRWYKIFWLSENFSPSVHFAQRDA